MSYRHPDDCYCIACQNWRIFQKNSKELDQKAKEDEAVEVNQRAAIHDRLP
jgi:hypothetical protein